MNVFVKENGIQFREGRSDTEHLFAVSVFSDPLHRDIISFYKNKKKNIQKNYVFNTKTHP